MSNTRNYADPQASANFQLPNSGKPDDPWTTFSRRENENRESWIKIMRTRDIRNNLRECFRREGVNHVDNCKEFALAYIAAISEPFTTGGVDYLQKGMAERAAEVKAGTRDPGTWLPMHESYKKKDH